MPQSNADLERLRAAYQAWHDTKGRSIDTWMELMADNVDFRSLANGAAVVPWTSTRTTREEVRAFLVGLTTDMAMQHFTAEQFVCQDDTIVMIGTTAWRHKATGKTIDTPIVDVWRFRNGKVVALFEYFDTAQLIAAATA